MRKRFSIVRSIPLKRLLRGLLKDLKTHPAAWPFLQPVNRNEDPDYYEVIKEPMDLCSMKIKLERNLYTDHAEWLRDAKLMFDNCRKYNNEATPYATSANKLERFLWERISTMPLELPHPTGNTRNPVHMEHTSPSIGPNLRSTRKHTPPRVYRSCNSCSRKQIVCNQKYPCKGCIERDSACLYLQNPAEGGPFVDKLEIQLYQAEALLLHSPGAHMNYKRTTRNSWTIQALETELARASQMAQRLYGPPAHFEKTQPPNPVSLSKATGSPLAMPEKELQSPKLFVNYTISQDCTGSNDANCGALLRALRQKPKKLQLKSRATGGGIGKRSLHVGTLPESESLPLEEDRQYISSTLSSRTAPFTTRHPAKSRDIGRQETSMPDLSRLTGSTKPPSFPKSMTALEPHQFRILGTVELR